MSLCYEVTFFVDTSFEMWYIIPSHTPRRIRFFSCCLPLRWALPTSGIICWRFKAPARLGTRDRRGRMMGRSHSLFISGCDILWGRAIVPQTKEDAITKAVFHIQALQVQGLPHDYSLIRLHLIPQSFYIYKARTHSLYCGHFWYGRYGLGCCPPYFFWGFAVIVWGFAVIVFSRHQVC